MRKTIEIDDKIVSNIINSVCDEKPPGDVTVLISQQARDKVVEVMKAHKPTFEIQGLQLWHHSGKIHLAVNSPPENEIEILLHETPRKETLS